MLFYRNNYFYYSVSNKQILFEFHTGDFSQTCKSHLIWLLTVSICTLFYIIMLSIFFLSIYQSISVCIVLVCYFFHGFEICFTHWSIETKLFWKVSRLFFFFTNSFKNFYGYTYQTWLCRIFKLWTPRTIEHDRPMHIWQITMRPVGDHFGLWLYCNNLNNVQITSWVHVRSICQGQFMHSWDEKMFHDPKDVTKGLCWKFMANHSDTQIVPDVHAHNQK